MAPADLVREPSRPAVLSGRRLLIAYSNASTFTTTTLEYVKSFAAHSSAQVHYLHVTHDAIPVIDLGLYDAVLLSYCTRLCIPGYVSDRFLQLMDRYDGVRAIAIQDEYDAVELERRGLDRLKPDVVFTCIPPDQRESVYPSGRYPNTEFVQVLTGYVPSRFPPASSVRPLAQRGIHLGYRGRDIGARYGMLGRMKFGIGEAFRSEALARGVPSDIAMDEASRIYGDAWYEWLAGCRCVLGTESGSNVFDFDGSIAAAFADRHAADSQSRMQARIDELDRTFRMGQISARIFEATVMRSALVLYEGRYSDAIRPNEHYIPVAHDHSNMDEVFRAIADVEALEAMVERAHAHLIRSGRFSYEAFVEVVDSALARRMRRPRCGGRAPVVSPNLDPGRSPLEELPTASPRGFDSFQLRCLRRQLSAPVLAIRAIVQASAGNRVARLVERSIPSSFRRRLRRMLG